MYARHKKKSQVQSPASTTLVQAQFQSQPLANSSQRSQESTQRSSERSTQEVSQRSQGQSFGHNFSQVEVQPATGTVVQPKPIMALSLHRAERKSHPSKQAVQQMNAPLQLTSIQRKEPVKKQLDNKTQPNKHEDRDPNLLLGNGKVKFDVISKYCDRATKADIERLNSNVIKNILKYPLQQSWHLAKEELALSDSETRRDLMKKLLDFRQHHHQEILQLTQKEINDKYGSGGLLASKGGGSDTLTSDIDVNLKGTHTEEAVKVFNRLFKADGWDYESGVVYDVNVYAIDFMHKFGGETVREGVGQPETSVTVKEGARGILSQGGFADKNSDAAKTDRTEQEEWALVKLRLYMTVQQWENYCQQTKLSQKTVKSVEVKYAKYLNNIGSKMYKKTNLKGAGIEQKHLNETGISKINDKAEIVTKVKSLQQTGQKKNQEVLAEELKMSASNRLYEDKLKEVTELRQQSEYNNLLGLANLPFFEEEGNAELEKKIKVIRSRVSESALYANEAYVTDGAVYHAVVGLQGGKQIQQTNAELMNVVTENLADALKEIARHGSSLGEAAYKAGKYYMRMTDAAKNMGLGKIAGVENLYNAGYEISVNYKNQSNLSEEGKQKQSSTYLKKELGINSIDALKNLIVEVATKIRKQFNVQGEAQKQNLGKAGPAKNKRNEN